ncbi:MAG: sigma-70 family RNA polymerase sigma factor [Bacteroidota bacterium]
MDNRILHTEKLLSIAEKGNLHVIQEIYILYYKSLLRYGCSIEADENLVKDVIHDLFVWLIQHPHQFADIQRIDMYLFKCLRRNMHAHLHKNRLGRRFQESKHGQLTTTETVESQLCEEETEAYRKEWLRSRIASLSPHQREIIYLRYFENLSFEEISEIQSVGIQVVRNSVYRALKNMRKNSLPKTSRFSQHFFLLVSLFF